MGNVSVLWNEITAEQKVSYVQPKSHPGTAEDAGDAGGENGDANEPTDTIGNKADEQQVYLQQSV
jgi:hypothetical protein